MYHNHPRKKSMISFFTVHGEHQKITTLKWWGQKKKALFHTHRTVRTWIDLPTMNMNIPITFGKLPFMIHFWLRIANVSIWPRSRSHGVITVIVSLQSLCSLQKKLQCPRVMKNRNALGLRKLVPTC